MNGQVSDEFQSRCEIDEPFDQFVASFSDHRLLLTSTGGGTPAANFTRAPLIDVCSASYDAVISTFIRNMQHIVCH